MTLFRRIDVHPGATAPLPKFWRPKLAPSKQLACQVIHWDLITCFTSGKATSADMWDWVETGLTYVQMMKLLTADGVDFTEQAVVDLTMQLEITDAVVARHKATGRVGFNGEELAIARAAAVVMDSLIALDRHGIADRAGRWSVEQMRRVRATGKFSHLSF